MKYLMSSLFVLCIMLSSLVQAQDSNPNKLPPCPKPDYSKSSDIGFGGRTEKWHNCYGRYVIELTNSHKGDVIEGEWRNGLLNGQGIYNHKNGEKYFGGFRDGNKHGQGSFYYVDNGKYIGAFLNDKRHGLGSYISPDGTKFYGEYKDNLANGQAIVTNPDGKQYEGIWENNNFIREVKVNLPTQNNITNTNTDRSENNPNKLPLCPEVDYSKYKHAGAGGRTEKWNKCWGRYVLDLNDAYKDDIFEGEFKNGVPNGKGTYFYLANNKFKGDIHEGEYVDGVRNGLGTYFYLANNINKGDKYVGEYRNGQQSGQGTYLFASGEKYVGEFKDGNRNGQGTNWFTNGDWYSGEFKNNIKHGHGTYYYLANNSAKGDVYTGEYKDDKINGLGILTKANGKRLEGIWENYNFIREVKVNLPNQNNNVATNTDRSDIDRERQQLAEERRRLEDEKRQRQQAGSSQRINLQVNHTQPNSDGLFFIDIKTNTDTASLQIDGKEEGGKSDGNYTLKRIARAGQSSSFKIVATDIYGNTDTKTINVTRSISEAKASYADLNPTNIKRRSDRDAVAIIIGIADYKNLPKADFANDDARVFYDYALRALSIKPENIKLLVDGDADEVAIYKAFKTWLPSKVRSSTDVYVFYSGHGLPTSDGKGLYLLPQRTDRDLISKTAIQMQEIISDIQSTKPKSVTLFLDACYSGQSRTGETLIASARPISIKSESRIYPDNFTVITASQNDQISSSNPDLKHGIFSYYLMRGMEGDADTDKDGKITLGEMQSYLVENVGRQAGMMNRKQEPQLIGDANKVLVGR
jgi:hypothetical protein